MSIENIFFDRAKNLELLSKRVNSFYDGYRQNIVILGEESLGKSSLLAHLFDSIDRERILPIYIEIRVEPFKSFVIRFIRIALSQLLNLSLPCPRREDIVWLIDNTRLKFPKVAKICIEVLQDTERGRFDDALSQLLDLPSILYESSKRRCLLALDEFHNLSNFNLKNPFGVLAKKIMVQTNTMYIVTSSRIMLSEKLIKEKLTLLFGNFEKILIEPFDSRTSREVLKSLTSPLELEQRHLDFIANFLGNRPLYLQVFAEYAKSLHLVEPDRFKYNVVDLVSEVFLSTIFSDMGLINQHFKNWLLRISIEKQSSLLISILQAISSDNKKQNEIARFLGVPLKTISKPLLKLLELELIFKNGPFYRFRNRLFSFWLNNVYLEKASSSGLNSIDDEKRFKEKIKMKFEAFASEYEKTLTGRIAELFGLFKNDCIQLNGKKHRLFQFEEIKGEQSKDASLIYAQGSQGIWRCLVKEAKVTENDVAEFIRGKRRSKDKRHIIVSLDGIEENAYLLAKEGNVWTWDLESVNTLLELYGKPQIIK